MEGDTKLSSRLASAALAVGAAVAGDPQLAVTKDSSLAQWQSVSLITEQILPNITQPLQPLHPLSSRGDILYNILSGYYRQSLSLSQSLLC